MRAPYRTLVPPTPSASSPEHEWRNGRLLISREADDPRRARVIGSLTGDSLQVLLDAVVDRGVAVLDLSGIDRVDHRAVRALATLWPDRCTLVACPRWLELWLARVRSKGGG